MKQSIRIEVDNSKTIPRVVAWKEGRKMSREEIMTLTDEIRFAMMLLMGDTCG